MSDPPTPDSSLPDSGGSVSSLVRSLSLRTTNNVISSTSFPHNHTHFTPTALTSSSSPAVRIDSNSLSTCFSFLLISEKIIASLACKYWFLISQSKQSWSKTWFYPANVRRFLRFPLYAPLRIQTLDFESIMTEECMQRFTDAVEEKQEWKSRKPKQSAKPTTTDEKDEYEYDSVEEASEDEPEPMLASESSGSSNSSAVDLKQQKLRSHPLWLRLMRHLKRYTKLEGFICTGLSNNDPLQVMRSLLTSKGTLKELNLSGACHPNRTCDDVKQWKLVKEFTKLETLHFPYSLGNATMKMIIMNSVPDAPVTANSETQIAAAAQTPAALSSSSSLPATAAAKTILPRDEHANNAQIRLMDEEVAQVFSGWLSSSSSIILPPVEIHTSASSSSFSSSSSSSTSTSSASSSSSSLTSPSSTTKSIPSFSLYSTVFSSTLSNLTSLCLKFFRSLFLNEHNIEEIQSRRVEHIYLRQLISQLPLLKKLKVYGMSNERCLNSICANPYLSKNLTVLILGFHGCFRHRSWKELELLNTSAPLLETLVLRCAIPNRLANPDDVAEEKVIEMQQLADSMLQNQQVQKPATHQPLDAANSPTASTAAGSSESTSTASTSISTATSASMESLAELDSNRPRTMNHYLLTSISRIKSLKQLALHLVHSIDENMIQIVYPLFPTTAEMAPLRSMHQLEQLELELVTRRTSKFLSRSFNPGVLPILFAPNPSITMASNLCNTLTHLTLFSPVLKDLALLHHLKKLKVLKLINTSAKIILKQKRKQPAPPPPPPPADVVSDNDDGDEDEDGGAGEGGDDSDDVPDEANGNAMHTGPAMDSDDEDIPSLLQDTTAADARQQEEAEEDEREERKSTVQAATTTATASFPNDDDSPVSSVLTPLHSSSSSSSASEGASPLSASTPTSSISDRYRYSDDASSSSSSDDDQDENIPPTARSAELRALRARCRYLAKVTGQAPMRRALHFTAPLPALETLTLSNFELSLSDFHTIAAQPVLTHINLVRCFVGKFHCDDTTQKAEERCKRAVKREKLRQLMKTAEANDKKEESDSKQQEREREIESFPSMADAVSACFAALSGSSSLTRLSHSLPDTGGASDSLLPSLLQVQGLTSLTLTNWAKLVSRDLSVLHQLPKLRHLEFYLAEFQEKQLEQLLPLPLNEADASSTHPSAQLVRLSSTLSVLPANKRQRSRIAHLLLIGCGVLTPQEEEDRRVRGITARVRDSAHHHSATPQLSCRPFYQWEGVESFLQLCFDCGISVKHKRYY